MHRRNQKRKMRRLRRSRVWGLYADPIRLWLTDNDEERPIPLLFTYEDAVTHFAFDSRGAWTVRVVPESTLRTARYGLTVSQQRGFMRFMCDDTLMTKGSIEIPLVVPTTGMQKTTMAASLAPKRSRR